MDSIFSVTLLYSIPLKPTQSSRYANAITMANSFKPNHRKRLPKNLRFPRRTKLPPDPGVNQFLRNKTSASDLICSQKLNFPEEEEEETELQDDTDNYYDYHNESEIIWDSYEIEAISSLFRGRIPQKPGKLNRERPLPLPLPHKLRPPGLPNPKIRPKIALSKQLYKRPHFLTGLARAIRSLAPEENVSKVLDKWTRFLHKGSLSLTIRELGHMGLVDRALQTFCWAQEQPQLFPDDRILASTIEILARNNELKVPLDLEEFTISASRGVLEAMIRGFIRGRSLNLAWKVLVAAKDGKRMLDSSVYVKLIMELGKNPDKCMMVLALLDELGQREALKLNQQDCTAVMKICIRLGKFEIAETLYKWYIDSGYELSVVMYTTLIHSRYKETRYREALSVIWEMEAANCLFDLPAYNVAIKLFVALGDLSRAVRYFAKLKEAGFAPTYDIYRNMITIYSVSGRLAKCQDIFREAEAAGYVMNKNITSRLLLCASEKMLHS